MSQILPIIFILIFHIPRSVLSIEFSISKMCNVTSLKDFSCNIVLNSSRYYLTDVQINSFSVITNANITITATMDTAEIHCVYNDSNYIASGVAFVNSSVFIERVSFNNCGAVINTLPYNIANVLNNSHYVYYPSSYATAFMLINCIVDWYQVKFISSYGFAVVGFNLIDATFTECAFSSAKSFQVYGKLDIGSGLLIHYSDPSYHGPVTSHLVVNNCTFSHNFVIKNCSSNDHDMGNLLSKKPITSSSALTLYYTQSSFSTHVLLNGTIFTENVGRSTNSLLIVRYTFNQLDKTEIRYCNFIEIALSQTCLKSAEMKLLYLSNNSVSKWPLVLNRIIFDANNDFFANHQGHSVYIDVRSSNLSASVVFRRVTFTNNTGMNSGVSLLVENPRVSNITLVFESVTVIGNGIRLPIIVSAIPFFSIFSLSNVVCIVNGTLEYPSSFSGNYGTVFEIVNNVNLYLYGHVEFVDNLAINGTAINIRGNSRLHLMSGLVASFEQNRALSVGGAIYAVVSDSLDHYCPFFVQDIKSVNVTFINNSARNGGVHIYAYPLINCYLNEELEVKSLAVYEELFLFSRDDSKLSGLLNLSSIPKKFLVFPKSGTVYPGTIFTVCISARDALNRSVYSSLEIENTHQIISNVTQTSLQYEKKTNLKENVNCTEQNLSVKAFSNEVEPFRIFFYPWSNRMINAFYSVSLQSCPVGFTLDVNNGGSCFCSSTLKKFHLPIEMDCSPDTMTIKRYNLWAGLVTNISDNSSEFAMTTTCPTGRCVPSIRFKWFKSNTSDIFVVENKTSQEGTSLCIGGREGILCSKCKDGLTFVFGTLECRVCKNYLTVWLFMLATLISGIGLVSALYLLKLTLARGTLNAIIFFAQMSNVGVRQIYLASPAYSNSPLYQIVNGFLALLNLETIFPICLYNGMDALWKVGLSLLFPLYLFLIVIVIIIVSHYSTRVSYWTSHSSVQVLVTIVHLSYARLLITIIEVFSKIKIYTEQGHYDVWYGDASVRYFNRRHQHLMIFSLLIIIPLTIPYTMILICSKCLRKSSLANKYLRPFIEAIHAPYKDDKHIWFTLRLILLIILYSIYANYDAKFYYKIFITTSLMFIGFSIAHSYARPYKANFLNILDSLMLFNITVVYSMTWYYNVFVLDDIDKMLLMISVCVLFVFCVLVCVVLYHVMCKFNVLEKINSLLVKKSNGYARLIIQPVTSIERNDSNHDSKCYREELLSSTYNTN